MIDAIRIHIYTSGFNFTTTPFSRQKTGDTEEGRRLCRFFTPRRGENKSNDVICPRLSGTVAMCHPRPSTVAGKNKKQNFGASVRSDGKPRRSWPDQPPMEPMLPTKNGVSCWKFHRFLGGNPSTSRDYCLHLLPIPIKYQKCNPADRVYSSGFYYPAVNSFSQYLNLIFFEDYIFGGKHEFKLSFCGPLAEEVL